ncbi:MAG: hypothetical protein HC877_16240 [Thioploca sp.]|nr:hypothetical protein [Thioploca sp.]
MFTRIYKYDNELNSYDVIKFLAIITMVIDHIGYYLVENNEYLRAVGRLAAPLFFFITGYVSNYQIKPAILVYGIIITGIFFYSRNDLYINILLVFASIKWILARWRPDEQGIVTLMSILGLIYLTSSISRYFIDYGFFGFAYALVGRLKATGFNSRFTAMMMLSTFLVQMRDIIISHDNIYVLAIIYVVAMLLFLTALLFRYQVIKINSTVLKNSVLICSRYSLEIYFWHVLWLELTLRTNFFTVIAITNA